MSEKAIFALLKRLAADVYTPEFYWVAAMLAVILAVSGWLSMRFRRRVGIDPADAGEPRNALQLFGAGSLRRLAFPVIALVLVYLLRRLLIAFDWPHLSLLYLAGPLLLTWLIVRFAVYVLRSVFARGGVLLRFERWITLTIWGGVVLDLVGLADPIIETLEQVSFPVGKQTLDLWVILRGSVTVCVTLLVALWIASLIERRLMAAEAMDGNVREVLSRLTKAILLLMALLLSLTFVGIDVTTLSVFSGALAVGLGFGLQKIASNYVSGFIILLDRSIRMGNLVAIDDKISGTITQITTRYTVMRMLNGTEIIIPNEYLVVNMIRNLSYTDTRVRIALSVQVAYGTDLERALQLLVDAASGLERVLADPAPFAMFQEFGDSGILLELGFWVADPEKGTGDVRSNVGLAVWRLFRENGIEIPYPQREVRTRDVRPQTIGA